MLAADPADTEGLTVRKSALNRLAADAVGHNLSETMWLKAEIADVDAKLAAR